MSDPDDLEYNKSIKGGSEQPSSMHTPKFKKENYVHTKTLNEPLNAIFSLDRRFNINQSQRSQHSLSPNRLDMVLNSNSSLTSQKDACSPYLQQFMTKQDINYNKFLCKAQKLESLKPRPSKQSNIKDRSCKSQLNFADNNNLKQILKEEQFEKGIDRSIDNRQAFSETKKEPQTFELYSNLFEKDNPQLVAKNSSEIEVPIQRKSSTSGGRTEVLITGTPQFQKQTLPKRKLREIQSVEVREISRISYMQNSEKAVLNYFKQSTERDQQDIVAILRDQQRSLLHALVLGVGCLKMLLNAAQTNPISITQLVFLVLYHNLFKILNGTKSRAEGYRKKGVLEFILEGSKNLPLVIFIFQTSLVYFLTFQNTTFDGLFRTAEILTAFLGFKVQIITDENQIFWQIIFTIFAVITRIHSNDGGLPAIISASVSSILLIAFVLLDISVTHFEKKEACDTPPRDTDQPRSQLDFDVHVWQTEIKAQYQAPYLRKKVTKTDSKRSSSRQHGSRDSRISSRGIRKRIVGKDDMSEASTPPREKSKSNSISSQFVIETSNEANSNLKQKNICSEESNIDSPLSLDPADQSHPEPASSDERFTQNQNSAINDYFLNNLSQGFMVCKLSNIPRKRNSGEELPKFSQNGLNSHAFLARSMDQNYMNSQSKYRHQRRRKIQLEAYQKSDNFFQQLPFYQDAMKLFNHETMSGIQSSIQQARSNRIRSQAFNSCCIRRNLIEESGVRSFQNNIQDLKWSKGSQHPLNQVFALNLSKAEEFLLEMKIYQPYFISNSTIIQFEGKNGLMAREKLSIMDIVELYFQKNQTRSNLFFKVNLADLSEMRLHQISNQSMSAQKRTLLENSGSLNQSIAQRILESLQKSSSYQMEEIKEQRHEQGSNYSKQNLRKRVSTRKFPDNLRKKSHSSKPQRHTSQEMNEVIWSMNDEIEEQVRPKVRNTGSLACMIKDLKAEQSPMIKKENCSSSSDIDIQYADEEDFQINKSIDDSNSSEATYKDFYDSIVDQLSSCSREKVTDSTRYYEFEIQQVDEIKDQRNLTFIQVKDVTKLVLGQQKFCDQVYQNAIENNFSHEQMTPLNPILTSATILKQKIVGLYLERFGLSQNENPNFMNLEQIDFQQFQYVMKNSYEAKQVMQMLLAIEQAAKLIWYYNTCNIKKMKIKKNELRSDPFTVQRLDTTIQEVLWPFEMLIVKRRHNVTLMLQIDKNLELTADWKLYELILFNLIQNSVKYNKTRDGDILIHVKCKPIKLRNTDELHQQQNAVLETMIIDTGVGISNDRQKLLFIPFLELKDRLGIMKSENDNIGIGLACSKDICKTMGGDIVLKSSREGLTAFSFKIPIKVTQKRQIAIHQSESVSASYSEAIWFHKDQEVDTQLLRLFGTERPIPKAIQSFLNLYKVFQGSIIDGNSQQKLKKSQVNNSSHLSKSVNVSQQPSLIYQRFGYQVLENIQRKMSRESLGINNSRGHLKKPKARQNQEGSQNSSYKNNIGRYSSNKEIFRARDGSQGNMSSLKGSINGHQNANIILNELEERKSAQSGINKSPAQQRELHSSSNGSNSIVYNQLSGSIGNSSDFEFEQNNIKEHAIEEQKDVDQIDLRPDFTSLQELRKKSSGNKNFRNNMVSQIEEVADSSSQSELQQQSIPNIRLKKRIAKPDSALAFKLQHTDKDTYDKALKRKCMSELLVNNHKNIVVKLFANQDVNHEDFEIEVDDDYDEEIQNILVDQLPRGQNSYCLRLAQQSDDGSVSESLDIIDIEPLRNRGIVPENSSSSFEVPVIRPEDFIVDSGDLRDVDVEEEKSFESIGSQGKNGSNPYSNQRIIQGNFSGNVNISSRNSVQLMKGQSIKYFGLREHSQVPKQQPINISQKKSIIISRDNFMCCKPRILCVDDGDMNLMALRLMLQSHHQITPDEAVNGQIAIDMFKAGLDKECRCANRAYKLILMDIQMPVKNGFEASEEILKLAAREEARIEELNGYAIRISASHEAANLHSGFCNIVAVTSYTGDDVKEKAHRFGIKQVIHKPLQANQLPEILSKYYN